MGLPADSRKLCAGLAASPLGDGLKRPRTSGDLVRASLCPGSAKLTQRDCRDLVLN